MDIKPPYGYRDIVPLTRSQRVLLQVGRHIPPSLQPLGALPLSFGEFAIAVRDYPIAFISGDGGQSFVAMILLGVEPGQNLFVDGEGRWDPVAYLPAYVRRHPFCMTRVSVNGQEQPERVACVEKEALQPGGSLLFDDKGGPLPLWEGLRRLLFEFEADLERTQVMARRLKELGLFEPFAAQAAPVGEMPITLTGMYRVSEEKLHALPADTLKELAAGGMLARIYLHIASLNNFQSLLDRRARQKTRGAGPKKTDPKKLN